MLINTCREGVEKIPAGEPILFNDCDHLFLCKSFYKFCNEKRFSENDAALLTFKSSDPRFSFALCGNDGFVTQTVEKQAISNNAICGAYYFNNKKIFLDAMSTYLNNCKYKEFFISGIYNILAQQ